MATSRYPTTNLSATAFVESSGVVLFRRLTREVAVLHHLARQEYLLPKGRRNIGESRAAAAIRECGEETGLVCRLVPVTLRTRCPPQDEVPGVHTPDEARVFANVAGEAFMLTVRDLEPVWGAGHGRKMISWFIGEVVEADGDVLRAGPGESEFEVKWCTFEDVCEQLTFLQDREIVRAALEIWHETFDSGAVNEGKVRHADAST